MEYKVDCGENIDYACRAALKLANKHGAAVEFTFNGTRVMVHPGELWRTIRARWYTDHGDGAAEELSLDKLAYILPGSRTQVKRARHQLIALTRHKL